MRKSILYDINLWFLLVFNLYLIFYYQQHTESFKTIACLYWVQSVVIGIVAVLYIARAPIPKGVADSLQTVGLINNSFGCSILFFIAHYGMFHLVYAVFLVVQVKGHINFQLFRIGVGLILLGAAIGFVRELVSQKRDNRNAAAMFFIPYLRIIPMHLMLLAQAFLGLSQAQVFLWLKTVMDLVTYLATRNRSMTT
jgi:hypothetical protein